MPRAAGPCWDGVLLNGLWKLAGRPQCQQQVMSTLALWVAWVFLLGWVILSWPNPGAQRQHPILVPRLSHCLPQATLSSPASSFSSLGGFTMPWSFWCCLATTCILMSFFISLFLCCEHRFSRMFRKKKSFSVWEKSILENTLWPVWEHQCYKARHFQTKQTLFDAVLFRFKMDLTDFILSLI